MKYFSPPLLLFFLFYFILSVYRIFRSWKRNRLTFPAWRTRGNDSRDRGGGERLKFCSFDLRHLPLTRRETDQKWDVARWMSGRFLHADGLAGCSRLVWEKLFGAREERSK